MRYPNWLNVLRRVCVRRSQTLAFILIVVVLGGSSRKVAGGEKVVTVAAVFPAAGAQDDAVEVRPSRSRTGWTDENCGSCHQTTELFSHPVGVTPTMRIPTQLPLFQGRMACTTCHEDNVDAHALARVEHAPLLRKSTSSASFCVQCHDPLQRTRTAQHGSSLGKAHLHWSKAKPAAIAEQLGGFDSETQSCLTCHDGVMSSDVAMTNIRLPGALPGEHPVGVSMRLLQAQISPNNPSAPTLGSPDPRIRLFNEQVGCNSCHSPFSQEPKLLVIRNDRSRLCLSCHQ